MSEEETLVPLDESDILAHCERQEQKIKKLEAALLEKEGENDALSERFNDQAESFQQTRAELAGREEQIAALKAENERRRERLIAAENVVSYLVIWGASPPDALVDLVKKSIALRGKEEG